MKNSTFILLTTLTITLPIGSPLEGIVDINVFHRNHCFLPSIGQILRCQMSFQSTIQRRLNTRPYYVNVNQTNEQQLKAVCCGVWEMTKCMKAAAIKWSDCRPSVLRVFNADMDNVRHRSDYRQCVHAYSEGSVGCGFPGWATVALVVLSVVIVAVITCSLHRICNHTINRLIE